jgi:hypothetical protein
MNWMMKKMVIKLKPRTYGGFMYLDFSKYDLVSGGYQVLKSKLIFFSTYMFFVVWKLSSGYTNGTTNIVRNNVITDCSSLNGQHIIGIDIAGESSDIMISSNMVNLNKFASSSDIVYTALMVGTHLESVYIDDSNDFKQKKVLRHNQLQRKHQRQLKVGNQEQQHHNPHLRPVVPNNNPHKMLAGATTTSSRGGCPMFQNVV